MMTNPNRDYHRHWGWRISALKAFHAISLHNLIKGQEWERKQADDRETFLKLLARFLPYTEGEIEGSPFTGNARFGHGKLFVEKYKSINLPTLECVKITHWVQIDRVLEGGPCA